MNEPNVKHSEYSAEQFAHNYPEGMENNYWIYARSLFVRHLLKRFCSPKTSILEVGCGAGIVLDCLVKAGFNCRGVELGMPRVLPSVEKLVWTGMGFQSLDAPYRTSVQAVLLLDVIEHIREPADFLREISAAMPNHESLLITVPARTELWSNYDEYYGLYLPMLVFGKLGLKRRVKNSGPKAVWLHRIAAYSYLVESLLLPRGLVGGSLYAIARKSGVSQ